MRLTTEQVLAIKRTVTCIIGRDSRVWLFGSRLDDQAKGGDIDLLVEAPTILDDRVGALCRLEGALVMALGDRKLDVLLLDGQTADAPIFKIAKREGVLL